MEWGGQEMSWLGKVWAFLPAVCFAFDTQQEQSFAPTPIPLLIVGVDAWLHDLHHH